MVARSLERVMMCGGVGIGCVDGGCWMVSQSVMVW
jgi:hypothetical protein